MSGILSSDSPLANSLISIYPVGNTHLLSLSQTWNSEKSSIRRVSMHSKELTDYFYSKISAAET